MKEDRNSILKPLKPRGKVERFPLKKSHAQKLGERIEMPEPEEDDITQLTKHKYVYKKTLLLVCYTLFIGIVGALIAIYIFKQRDNEKQTKNENSAQEVVDAVDETEESSEDAAYVNEILNFSVVLPAKWKTSIFTNTSVYRVNFLDSANNIQFYFQDSLDLKGMDNSENIKYDIPTDSGIIKVKEFSDGDKILGVGMISSSLYFYYSRPLDNDIRLQLSHFIYTGQALQNFQCYVLEPCE